MSRPQLAIARACQRQELHQRKKKTRARCDRLTERGAALRLSGSGFRVGVSETPRHGIFHLLTLVEPQREVWLCRDTLEGLGLLAGSPVTPARMDGATEPVRQSTQAPANSKQHCHEHCFMLDAPEFSGSSRKSPDILHPASQGLHSVCDRLKSSRAFLYVRRAASQARTKFEERLRC